MASSLIAFFVLLGTLTIVGGDDCDAVKALKVCRCLEHSISEIVCSNVTDGQQMVESLRRLNSHRPVEFLLENTNTLAALPAHLFKEYNHFRMLEMWNVDLPFLGSPIDESSPLNDLSDKLYTLILKNVRSLHNWDWSKVKRMEHLTEIIIEDSSFVSIQSSFARPFQNVVVLKIEHSNVHWIENGAIPSKELQKLNLQLNSLQNFSLKAFSGEPKNLEELDLSGNQIESLEEDLLNGMLYLEALFLSDNKLFQVSEKLFEPWKRPTKRRHLCVVFEGTRMNEEDKRVIDVLKSAQYDITVSKDYC